MHPNRGVHPGRRRGLCSLSYEPLDPSADTFAFVYVTQRNSGIRIPGCVFGVWVVRVHGERWPDSSFCDAAEFCAVI